MNKRKNRVWHQADFEIGLAKFATSGRSYESGMSVPPESGGYYGYSPSNEVVPTPESSGEQKRCTVRGCRLFIDANSSNKMCESCRGKHRIYASTKRAKRKLEKAAVSELVPIERVPESVSWMSLGDGDEMQPDGPPQSFTDAYHSTTEPRLSPPPVSPSHHRHHWTGTIDPRLFPTSNSSSELAGALTLPPTFARPAPIVVQDAVEPPPAKRQRTVSPEPEIAQPSSSETARTDLPSRFCSVKGCRLIIAASYPYKMCEPCRNRYRHYGITKRRKWKAERAAFEQELDNLLEAEEVKRRAMGLPPLADSPDELFKWQQTIVDEKVSLPENISTMAAAYSEVSDGAPLPITPTVFTAPLSHAFDNPLNLPPHMCTVSHCHKILPGSYQYKRCEQHRVQNRHHSELKRVREKVVKATGPPEGAVGETFEMGREDVSMKDEASPDWSPPHQPKGKKKKIPKQVLPEELRESTSLDYEDEFIKEKERAERKHRTWCCTAPGCHNIIPPTTRWRMCDPCRGARKALQAKRKAQMEQELLEAEEAWQRANGGQPSSSTLAPTPRTPSADGPAQIVDATSASGSGDVSMQADVDHHALPTEQIEEALPPPEERPPSPVETPTSITAPEPTQSAGNSQSRVERTSAGLVAPSLLSSKPNSHMSENATGYEAVALTTTFTPSISQSEKVSQTPKSRPSDLPMSIDAAAPNPATATTGKKKGRPRSQRAGKITSAATVPASASPEPTTGPPSNAQASSSKPVPTPPHPSTPTSASTPPYPSPYPYAGHPYQYPYYTSPYGLPPPYAVPPGSSDPTRPPMPSDPHGPQDPYSVPPSSYPPYSYPYPYTPYQQQYPYSNYYSPYPPSPYASRYPYSYPPPPPPSQIKRRNRKKASEKDTSTIRTSAQSKDPTPRRDDDADLTSNRQQETPSSSALPDPAPDTDAPVVRTPRAPSPKPPCPDEQNAIIQTRLASLNEVASTTLQPAQFSFNPDTLKFRPSSYSAMVPPASTGNRSTASQTTSFIPYNPENPKRARYHAGKRPVIDFSNLPETTHRSYQSQFTLKLLPKPTAEPPSFVVGDLLRARVASNLVDAIPVTAPEPSSTADASPGETPIIVAPLSSEVSAPPSKEATPIATQPSPEMIIDVTLPSSQPPSAITLPSRESSAVEPATAEAIPDIEPSGSKTESTTITDSEAQTSQSQRICGTKSCQRTIASDILGGLCGKCRAKMKKHQINAKQRFKLEPKQSILARVQVQGKSVKEGRSEDGH